MLKINMTFKINDNSIFYLNEKSFKFVEKVTLKEDNLNYNCTPNDNLFIVSDIVIG